MMQIVVKAGVSGRGFSRAVSDDLRDSVGFFATCRPTRGEKTGGKEI